MIINRESTLTSPLGCPRNGVHLFPLFAHGRTFHVEKDGSGDYTVIQDAVNIAADGDTILIGPGRYEDSAPVQHPTADFPVCVQTFGQDIVIRGSGQDATFIGPVDQGDLFQSGCQGMVDFSETGSVMISDLTVENLAVGVYTTASSFELLNCCVKGSSNSAGVFVMCQDVVTVEECEITDNDNGIMLYYSTAVTTIRNGVFMNNDNCGIYNQSVDGVEVINCQFEDSRVYSSGGGIILEKCAFRDCYSRCVDLTGGTYDMSDCTFDGDRHSWCLYLSHCAVTGTGNILRGASRDAIRLNDVDISFTGNHIFSGDQFIKAVNYNTLPIRELDFRNNYWGTTDAEEISARIEDGYDDPSEYVHVLFEPFSSVPLPDEKKSLGDVKRMFR